MASWLTAQLKAAEGLLEAVDKTVSRTVGTLSLAEGETEQLTPEYGVPRSSSNLFQASSVGTYQQSFSAASSGPAVHPTNTYTGAPSYYSAATNPSWEARSTAPTFTSPGTSSGRALTAAGDIVSAGAAAGFTVKDDTPIPFVGQASTTPTSALADANSSSSSSAPPHAQPISAVGTAASSSLKRPSTDPPTTTAGARVSHERSPSSATPSSNIPPLSIDPAPVPIAHAVAPIGPLPARSTGDLGPEVAALPPPHPSVQASVPPAADAAAPAPRQLPPGPLDPNSSLGTGVLAAPAHVRLLHPPHQEVAPGPLSATQPAGGQAAGSAPAPGPSNYSAGGIGTATSPSKGEAARAPEVSGTRTPSAAGPNQAQSSGAGTSPAPVAALASATTAAASTIAAATTTAVTHSLSFFNLVLDDPDVADGTSSASSGGGGGASAQQFQSLSRTCEQLRKRLESSRLENEQLEDLLARAEVRAQQEAALVGALREELTGLQQARFAAEGGLEAQLAVARSSLAEVSYKYETSQRAVLVLEGRLAALEESSRRLMEQHNDREGGMLDALMSELAAAEARLAAESKSYQAARAAAAARERDLEQQIADSTAALGELTRSLEEANRKCRGLEEEAVAATRGCSELSAQVAALHRRLEEAGLEVTHVGEEGIHGPGAEVMGGTALRGRAAAAAATAELEVLRHEVVQHQRAAHLASQAAESSQAQVALLAEEVEALRRVAEQRKDTSDLEAQLREVSEMLYLKQTQMERLAMEKAAQQIKTERELESVRQELAKLTRQVIQQGGGRGLTDGSGSGISPHDVIPMDALGEPYQRLMRHNRVGSAVRAAGKFLDSTAFTTAFVLRQYPLARLLAFLYALLIHLYVYLLIARMQRLATHLEAAAVAPSGA